MSDLQQPFGEAAVAVEDAHVAVKVHTQFERQRTRRFETVATIAAREREQPEARPIAVLGMALFLQKSGDERAGGAANLLTQWISRCGVHSRWAPCAAGICSTMVV